MNTSTMLLAVADMPAMLDQPALPSSHDMHLAGNHCSACFQYQADSKLHVGQPSGTMEPAEDLRSTL